MFINDIVEAAVDVVSEVVDTASDVVEGLTGGLIDPAGLLEEAMASSLLDVISLGAGFSMAPPLALLPILDDVAEIFAEI